MSYVRGEEKLRKNTKLNLLRTFTILYFTGLRVNEIQQLKVTDIKQLIEKGEVKIYLPKTSSERKPYLRPNFKKELLKIFDFRINELNY